LSTALRTELLAVALLLSVVSLVGILNAQPATALCLALTVYLLWHLVNLWRLQRWLALGAGSRPRFHGLARELAERINDILVSRAKGKGKRSWVLKRLREAFSALPDAAVIMDRNNRIEWCNPAARHLLGFKPTQNSGKPITRLIPDMAFQAYLATQEFDQPLEIPAPSANGLYLSVQLTRFGKKQQRLLIARDITQLRNLDLVHRDFIANVSHELRTPLTVMSGFLETMVEDAEVCPEWRRSVELMEQQSRRMQALVNDLLVLSRLEMENEGEREPVPAPVLLASIASEARSVSGEHHHDISLDADTGLWLLGNPGQLQSIFSNLVINAVQHTPPGTRIEVVWRRSGDEAVFSVADSGDGIPPEHLPRLTERFYRVDKARSRRRGGTGLGLAIVKHALARHDSRLEVSSPAGQGARFECWFDANRITEPAADSAAGD